MKEKALLIAIFTLRLNCHISRWSTSHNIGIIIVSLNMQIEKIPKHRINEKKISVYIDVFQTRYKYNGSMCVSEKYSFFRKARCHNNCKKNIKYKL